MSACILHIGMHKTGTTSIQNSLEGFSDDKHLYACLWRQPNHSVPLRCRFHPRDAARKHPEPFIKNMSTSVGEAFKKIQSEIGNRTLILSAEGVNTFTENSLQDLHDFLAKSFGRVVYVAYVRSPAAYANSKFQQEVKSGIAAPLLNYREYRPIFDKFDRLAGKEMVHLRKFDPSLFPDGCVVKDFVQSNSIHLPYEKIRKSNESLSAQAVSLLYTYAKYRDRIGAHRLKAPISWAIYPALQCLGHDKFRISPEVIAPLLEAHRADILWMEERLGCSLAEDLGGHRQGDISTENDLIEQALMLAEPLHAIVQSQTKSAVPMDKSPEGVARMLHELAKPHMRKSTVS